MVRRSKNKGKVSLFARKNKNTRRYGRGVPAALGSRARPNRLNMGEVHDPMLGHGIRLSGSTAQYQIRELNGSLYAFIDSVAVGVGTATNSWYKYVSPDSLSSGIALIAAQYTHYRFLSLSIEYEPAVSSANARSLRIAYVPDVGYTLGSAPTFASAADLEYNVASQVWQPCKLVVRPVPRDKTAYENKDIYDTVSSARSTIQGALIAVFDGDPGGTVVIGSIRINYVVELFNRSTGLGFTITELRRMSELHNRETRPTVELSDSKDDEEERKLPNVVAVIPSPGMTSTASVAPTSSSSGPPETRAAPQIQQPQTVQSGPGLVSILQDLITQQQRVMTKNQVSPTPAASCPASQPT